MAQFYLDSIQTPEALSQFGKLLDCTFPVPKGSHFFDDFPVWNSKLKVLRILRLGVFHGTELVSSAAVRMAELKGPNNTPLPVAILGAVATHPDWRGKGFASQTVNAAVEWARGEKAELVMLWGSEHALYQRLGFHLCGEQIQIPLNHVKLKVPLKEQVSSGWNRAIFSRMKQRAGGLVLQDNDQIWIEAHRNVEWYYTGPSENPTAYAGYGRGIDLNGMVHEWGGKPDSLFTLLKYLREKNPTSVLLASPKQLGSLGIPYEPTQIEYLCMAKSLNSNFTLTDLKGLWVWGLDAA
jgi:predicted GNAT family N-acyltransferase